MISVATSFTDVTEVRHVTKLLLALMCFRPVTIYSLFDINRNGVLTAESSETNLSWCCAHPQHQCTCKCFTFCLYDSKWMYLVLPNMLNTSQDSNLASTASIHSRREDVMHQCSNLWRNFSWWSECFCEHWWTLHQNGSYILLWRV